MGVNLYILDKIMVRLAIGKTIHCAGTLRRFWKITEMTAERERERELQQAVESAPQSPVAVMLAEPCEEAAIIHGDPSLQRAHLVLGWDSGRFKTTDFNWDYLPVLGYAIREPANDVYRLYEMSHGELLPIDEAHAVELQVLNRQGELISRGQPKIVECREVQPFIDAAALPKFKPFGIFVRYDHNGFALKIGGHAAWLNRDSSARSRRPNPPAASLPMMPSTSPPRGAPRPPTTTASTASFAHMRRITSNTKEVSRTMVNFSHAADMTETQKMSSRLTFLL